MALVNRADREQWPGEELLAELVAAGLDHLDKLDRLRETWDSLSPRERMDPEWLALNGQFEAISDSIQVEVYLVLS